MSINPIAASATTLGTLRTQRQGPDDSRRTGAFAEALSIIEAKKGASSPQDQVQAANAAAEVFRLEMLKSALSIGDEFRPSPSSALSTPVRLAASNTLGHSQNIDTQPESRQQQIVEQVTQRGTNTPGSIQEIIGSASERYGIDEALIKAVIKAESNFNPNAVSHAGAQGLMQLMPGTARGLGVTDSFNAEQNVMAGTRFLKDMLKRYNGNLDSALAAYNWGPGNVDRKGTSVLPQETREYLAKVKGYYSQYTG